MCSKCGKAIASWLDLFEICGDCYIDLDGKLKKLISEFLDDWKWGRAYGIHFSWLNFYDHCRCKPTIIQYWKWFEEKWEAKLKK